MDIYKMQGRKKYIVTFFQQGAECYEPEYFNTLKEARLAAADFIKDLKRGPLKQKKSVYRDNYALLQHPAYLHNEAGVFIELNNL